MNIYDEIRTERERAHAKHGDKSMESWQPGDHARLAILLEEVGEVAREFNEAKLGETDIDLTALRAELVQVAAMAAAWADICPAHPCGHLKGAQGCGGCDPGAVEYVRDDFGYWRKVDAGVVR